VGVYQAPCLAPLAPETYSNPTYDPASLTPATTDTFLNFTKLSPDGTSFNGHANTDDQRDNLLWSLQTQGLVPARTNATSPTAMDPVLIIATTATTYTVQATAIAGAISTSVNYDQATQTIHLWWSAFAFTPKNGDVNNYGLSGAFLPIAYKTFQKGASAPFNPSRWFIIPNRTRANTLDSDQIALVHLYANGSFMELQNAARGNRRFVVLNYPTLVGTFITAAQESSSSSSSANTTKQTFVEDVQCTEGSLVVTKKCLTGDFQVEDGPCP